MRRTPPGYRRRPSSVATSSVGLNGAPGNGPKPVMRIVVVTALDSQQAGNLVGGGRRRHSSIRDRGFEPRQLGPERGIGFEPREYALLQDRPHPLHLLLAAARLELAGLGDVVAMLQHDVPELGDALAGQR